MRKQAQPMLVLEFIKLTRPLFLMGGFLLYALGALAAVAEGHAFHLGRFISGQLLVTSIQLMTHYVNEYFDQEGDQINTRRTWFSGGSGVLASGTLSPRVAWMAAAVLASMGVLALISAGLQVPLVLAIGGLALAAAWSYSGPPLTLARTGWGEFSASLVVAGMVPLVGFAMQSGGAISPTLLVILVPLVLIHFAMLVAFQVPDQEADAACGKRTLCVRMGLERTGRLHNLSLLLAFCVILGLFLLGWPGSQLAWLGLPVAAVQAARFQRYTRGEPGRYLWLTMRAVGLFALTTGLWLAGYILTLLQA